MAGLFDTSTTTMRTTATRVLSDADLIRTDLAGLLNKLTALEGAWIGDGRTAFTGAEARYSDANARLNAALDEISRLISANEARYTSDDASAQSALSAAGSNFAAPGF
ncbi:WXG100 family type VII secretion target [Quadrisphaera oryzae]|uniref:WXG100 family type VII secretion target n=1 Tax=Quadrisphaera TaxID=317661 RepID=UPI00164696AC|nr:WXG100 family type VII secretion target [Quadrisphaera sp. RL12-1S]MBC3762301.1 WXG100 family type VII secretion target [Quadrisphaera sp. RL12-1S]